jgi:hypothetical protein
MNKTTTRPPGRPKKTAAQSAPSPTKTPTIKRTEKEIDVHEYVSVSSGAVLLLLQSGITVYDKELDSIREIRYCERENSIYRDEQSETSIKSPIIFKEGRLFVPGSKPNLKAFLEAHPENKSNGGNLFYKVDLEKKVSKSIEAEFLVNDAITMLRSKPLEDLLSVALGYSIDIDRPVSEIKHDLLRKAKASPKQFIESFDNPVVAMKAKIRQAISYQVIKADSDAIKWFDTNAHIISVPAGKDPVDVFVRYCLTEKASELVDEIDKQLA